MLNEHNGCIIALLLLLLLFCCWYYYYIIINKNNINNPVFAGIFSKKGEILKFKW